MLAVAALLGVASLAFWGARPQLAATGDHVYLVFGKGDVISVARSMDAGKHAMAHRMPSPCRADWRSECAAGPVSPLHRVRSSSPLSRAREAAVPTATSSCSGRLMSAPHRPAIVINDVPGAAREGLHGMAANAAGVVVIAWLDRRAARTRINAATSRDHR